MTTVMLVLLQKPEILTLRSLGYAPRIQEQVEEEQAPGGPKKLIQLSEHKFALSAISALKKAPGFRQGSSACLLLVRAL